MLKVLRTQTKTIMWLVAVAFVGLMLFDWGMDYSGSGGGSRRSDAIGTVTGEDSLVPVRDRALQQPPHVPGTEPGRVPGVRREDARGTDLDNLVGETLLRQRPSDWASG